MILVVDNAVEGGYMAGEVARLLPDEDVETFNFPNEDEAPSLEDVDGVVIGGSASGVYDEPDQPWITRQKEFVRDLVDAEIPVLGICFGHQVVNAALGGDVENSGISRNHFVEASFEADPLFEGVDGAVPVLHSDVVTERGEGMEPLGETEYNPNFATRHCAAPVWTVQYHPEFTEAIVPEYEEYWEDDEDAFEGSTATRTLENFSRLVREQAEASD